MDSYSTYIALSSIIHAFQIALTTHCDAYWYVYVHVDVRFHIQVAPLHTTTSTIHSSYIIHITPNSMQTQ